MEEKDSEAEVAFVQICMCLVEYISYFLNVSNTDLLYGSLI